MSLVSHTYRLPSDTPVLVSKLMVGHRPVFGKPKCGTEAKVFVSTALAAYAFHVAVCVQCWGGEQPW